MTCKTSSPPSAGISVAASFRAAAAESEKSWGTRIRRNGIIAISFVRVSCANAPPSETARPGVVVLVDGNSWGLVPTFRNHAADLHA